MTALDIKEFIAGFLVEAEELLSSSAANLLAVEEALRHGQSHPRAVRDLFRSLHTLKGLSAMIGAEPIVDIAHEMETLLRVSDRAGGHLPADAVDTLLRGLRAIEERVALLARDEPLPAAPHALLDELASTRIESNASEQGLAIEAALLAKLVPTERAQLANAIAAGRRALRVEFTPSLATSALGLNITAVRERLGKLSEIVKVIPRSVAARDGKPASVAFVLLIVSDAADEAIAAAAGTDAGEVTSIAAAPSPSRSSSPLASVLSSEGPIALVEGEATFEGDGDGLVHRSNFVRVDVARLDAALDHLSAIVVTMSRLERAALDLAQGTGSVRALLNIVGEKKKMHRDLRGSIMRARMVPVRDVLDRAPLLVRGLSKASGKQVRLILDVGDSELDKSVADRLFPAVVHLLRNAVDHAIEPVAARLAAGKPEEGQIRVTCRRRSDNQLELIIEDDGAGIDRKKIAGRAGLPVAMSDDELLALVSRPGLSTRDQVTQTSGRGMGMDIVRRIVVDELGGEMGLQTQPGQGTRFTLIVPLSITILDVFSFRCAGRVFVVPVSAVDDFAELDPSRVHRTPGVGNERTAQLLSHRSATIPLFRLSTLLGLPRGRADPADPVDPADPAAYGTKAIIVRRNAEVFGFEVDRLIGQQEVVVRPLQDPLVKVVGIAGSTDLGDGQATLVLDLHALAQNVSRLTA